MDSLRPMPVHLLALTLVLVLGTSAAWAQPHWTVVDADAVIGRSTPIDATTIRFVSEGGRSLTLGLDPRCMEINNPIAGDRFHPLDEELARRILSQMVAMPPSAMEVTIYLLPGLPTVEMSSFCSGAEVFIAAGLADWPEAVAASTLTHEIGHAVQHLGLPGRRGPGWERYLELRGLTDTSIYSEQAAHYQRPAEIFAEDFRVLFGGEPATVSGTQENPDLPSPETVDGLREFFLQVMALQWLSFQGGITAHNVPNPFNPSTVILLDLAEEAVLAGGQVQVVVFDARGRLVRRFEPVAVSPQIQLHWEGRDDAGRPVASGRYVYRARVGASVVTGSMILLK